MKAARVHQPGAPLVVEEVPEPILRRGSAVVRILNAFVPPVMSEIVGPSFHYPIPRCPFTPGLDAVGVVEAVGERTTGLTPGELVYCDHFFESLGDEEEDDACFLGNFGIGSASAKSLEEWRNGCFAELEVLPAECFVPLVGVEHLDSSVLCRLGWLGTAYAAFQRAGLTRGQNVVINGATGLLGAGAVLLALALGAERVVALGRRTAALDELEAVDRQRVKTICLAETSDPTGAIRMAVDGRAHVALDAVGSIDDPVSTVATIRSLGRRGVAILIGNATAVLPLGYDTLLDSELTITGSNWFTKSQVSELIQLIAAGKFDTSFFRARTFALADVNDALSEAHATPGCLDHVALEMQ